MESQTRPVIVKTFTGATQALAAEQFATDAVKAAELGYTPTSQAWEGTTLTVIYQRQAPMESSSPAADPDDPREAARQSPRPRRRRSPATSRVDQPAAPLASTSDAPPPPTVNVEQKSGGGSFGGGMGQGMGQGIGFGTGCVIFIAFLVVGCVWLVQSAAS